MPVPLIAGAIAAAPAIGRTLMMGAGFAPLIMDMFSSGGADKESIDKVVAMRDEKVQQLVGSGMKPADAQAQVNAEIEPILAGLHKSDSPSGGELLADVATAAGGLYGAKKLFSKGAAKSPPTSKVPENTGTSQPGKPTQEVTDLGKRGDGQVTRHNEKAPMDEPEMVHNAVEEKAEAGFRMNSPRIGMDGFTGGSDPVDADELMRKAIIAKMQQRQRMNPGMSGVAIPMGMSEQPMLRLDNSMTREANAAEWELPSGVPSPLGQKARNLKRQQMEEMYTQRDMQR